MIIHRSHNFKPDPRDVRVDAIMVDLLILLANNGLNCLPFEWRHMIDDSGDEEYVFLQAYPAPTEEHADQIALHEIGVHLDLRKLLKMGCVVNVGFSDDNVFGDDNDDPTHPTGPHITMDLEGFQGHNVSLTVYAKRPEFDF